MNLLTLVIILALLAAGISLMFGLVSLGKGPKFDPDQGTGFMWARVGFQLLAVLLILLALLIK